MIVSGGTIFQLGALLLSVLIHQSRSASFVRAPRPIEGGVDGREEAQTRYRETYRLYLTPDIKEPGENPIDLKNFNPFQQQKQGSRSSSNSKRPSSSPSSPNIISLRQTQMQQIMSQMLEAVSKGEDVTKQVLETHKDFLLEPLEDEEAVLEVDSIYTAEMTRQERYQAYKSEMQKRIDRARDPNAKKVLQNMMEFVLSHEQ